MNTEPSRRAVLATLAMAGAGAGAMTSKIAGALPAQSAAASSSASCSSSASLTKEVENLIAYFDKTVPQLLRPASGNFKHSSIAPSLVGKQYSGDLWDWDTYWTARGLFRYAHLKNDKTFHAQVAEHARGSLLIFFEHQSPEGRLPIMMPSTGPERFGSSNPMRNQAKPVLAQLALLIAEETKDASWLESIFAKLIKFHDSWLATNKSTTGLLVWSNGLGIGNDNDPTTSGRPEMSAANPLLNCMFYQDLRAAATLAGRLNRTQEQKLLILKADAFGTLIQKVLWDPRDQFFYTADAQVFDDRIRFGSGKNLGMDFSYQSIPIRIKTFTGFLPLWCGLATPDQARQLLDRNYRSDDQFRANFGVRSLSSRETMYSLIFSGNPSNWLGPIWIIANYLVWRGLKNYGTQAEADDLANKTIRLLANDLETHDSLNEYYHPDTGEALSHPGFMDWNLLVLEMTGSAIPKKA